MQEQTDVGELMDCHSDTDSSFYSVGIVIPTYLVGKVFFSPLYGHYYSVQGVNPPMRQSEYRHVPASVPAGVRICPARPPFSRSQFSGGSFNVANRTRSMELTDIEPAKIHIS
jgi:hypothetical protein